MESEFDLPAMRKASFYKKGSVEVNVFSNGSPDIVGKYKAIFPEGALYQIIYNDGKSWAFYNDTSSNEMTVEYEFGPTSVIEPLGRCEMSVKPDRWISCKLSIYPGCTEKFITGKPNGFRVNYRSGPLSDEYKEHIRRVCERRIQQETEVVRKFNIKPVGIMRDIAMECFRRNVRFVDLQFLPQAQSIARPTDIRKAEVTTWQRPCHYLPSDYKQSLIVSAIEPNDIDQGSLGDCWLMCALACLAEHPSRIMNLLIRHPYEDSIGYYTVQINQSGWWMTVAVDDYLPVNAKVPCFAKNHDERGEMWVAIFEKAFAKVFGSYSALIGGDSLDAIRDLTGAPGVRIDNRWCLAAQNPTGHHALQLFEELMEASSKNWVISVSTPWSSDTEFRMKLKIASIEAFRKSYELVGLSMGHSYSVLEVVEFPQHNLRLLKIRNPWGDGTEWNGSWSDESLMWKRYPDVKAACKCVVSNDGTFWMTFEDVLQYFCSLSLCMVADTPHDYRIRGQFVDGYPSVMLSLTVSVPAKITFLLCNPDLRNRQSEASPPQKATLLHIAEWKASSDSNTYHVIANSTMDHTKRSCDWNFTYSRDQSVTLTLNPSPHPYLVIPNTYEKSSYRQSYVIGLLSDVSLSSKDSVHVKFLQPESNMKLFSKFPQFNLVAKQGIDVEFQKYEKGREIPTLHGSSLI